MQLKSLHLTRDWADKDQLKGTVEFTDTQGDIKIQLKQEHVQGILAVVADGLVASAQEVANNLTAKIIEEASGSNLLEHKI